MRFLKDPDEEISTALNTAQSYVYAGRFNEALELLSEVLASNADNIDALYMRAVCQRYAKQADAARSTLSRLQSLVPEFGRAHQEEGHLLRELGQPALALAAYQLACQANPALEASWRAQASLLSDEGRLQESAHAKAQADRLAALPNELVAATNLIHEGKLLKAEQVCKSFLRRDKHNIEGMRLLADIASRFGVLDDAELLISTAHRLAPKNIQVHLDHIQILRKRQKYAAALEQAKALYDSDPANPVFQSQYAIENMQSNRFDRALELFDEVLKKLPNDPATLTSRGHALKTYGRQDEAIDSYRMACKVKPDHGDAYYALANLKTYEFSTDELSAMELQEARSDLSYHNRIHLCFGLGKAYEDKHAFEKSFGYYSRGNELKRVQSRYDSAQMTDELRMQSEVCSAKLFTDRQGSGHAAADPIFIVGLPRAGSTLLEQILASHSQIDGTLELPNILALSHRLRAGQKIHSKTGYPSILFDLSDEQLESFGSAYLSETRIHRESAPFFIDKMPNNFRHIGLIQLILPNAKIIDARRNPMACCFSGFKQLFAEGQEFTYGLQEVGTYYRDYVELMDHWANVLPGKVLRIQYEDVVADLEKQARRLLDYLELPFEKSCIDFHKTKRSVRTASSEQVRQPIFKGGLDQWRNYEPWLNPLAQALGPELLDR